MKWLIKIESIFTKILQAFVALSFLSIVIMIITLVILRYVFNTTIIGGNEFVVILFIYTSALGAAIIVRKREHIAITYFIDKLNTSYKKTIDVLNFLFIAFINGVMVYFSIPWIERTGSYTTAVLSIPQIFAQIIVPIGCGIAILYCFYHVILIIGTRNIRS